MHAKRIIFLFEISKITIYSSKDFPEYLVNTERGKKYINQTLMVKSKCHDQWYYNNGQTFRP